MKKLILGFPIAAFVILAAQSNVDKTYIVSSCNDGDTCRMQLKGTAEREIKVRLVGIDAPEMGKKIKMGQPFGEESKKHLNSLVQNKEITLKSYGADIFKRELGELYLNGKNINVQMVKDGYAEVYQGKAPAGMDKESYLAAETTAKKEKLGIWNVNGYQSPKVFRARKK